MPIHRAVLPLALLLIAVLGPPGHAETIVLIRHGEKPAAGLGQLSCQGLNRALALPAVLHRRFGHPDAIFAPDPAVKKSDSGIPYDYIRPLATVEPTAIAAGLPVDVSIGLTDTATLRHRLEDTALAGKTVLVAWEHRRIPPLARALLTDLGADAGSVPDWSDTDYDGIDLIRIDAAHHATFTHLQQGLNSLSTTCPDPIP